MFITGPLMAELHVWKSRVYVYKIKSLSLSQTKSERTRGVRDASQTKPPRSLQEPLG